MNPTGTIIVLTSIIKHFSKTTQLIVMGILILIVILYPIYDFIKRRKKMTNDEKISLLILDLLLIGIWLTVLLL